MPLVSAKCTNCGANLEVDSVKDAAICPYCGSPYIVEKAINNFNVTNNINANVVNVFGGNSADFVIRAGTLEKYNGASVDVIIPNSVTTIGGEAFKDCRGLKSIVIPDGVTTIGFRSFMNCTGLTDLVIPKSVTSIQHQAFANCSGLLSLVIPDSVTEISFGAFENCRRLTDLIISNGVASLENSIFQGCSGLTSIVIPDSVTSICSSTFQGCSGLTNIIIPNSVVSIGPWAFKDCSGLTNLVLSDNVTSISNGAFENCSGLTDISISKNVTSIDCSAFKGCSRLKEIIIPKGVTSIGENAFAGCSSLEKVVIEGNPSCPLLVFPKSVASIIAPEDWKKAHSSQYDCLSSYKSIGCYIATSIYGSYDCPQVWTLRRFRDYTLAETWYGRAFIHIYYTISPMLVKWFGEAEWFRSLWKPKLDRIVKRLKEHGVADTPYQYRQW
ncbi:MAG: leucine-rich repeat protein [Clostridia bacterium]|nr:leucine-rich repeat protein [Clostridia bacterium]